MILCDYVLVCNEIPELRIQEFAKISYKKVINWKRVRNGSKVDGKICILVDVIKIIKIE